jgi:hypothetical protein
MQLPAQEAFALFLEAKAELEKCLAAQAIVDGVAKEGDTFKFAYRHIGQGSIGMAIDAPAKGKASGFAGLKRPVDAQERETAKLADYLRDRSAQGRRY